MADLSQRTSRTGTPRPGIDPFVYTALQTSEFFDVSRPDILDSDRDHLYEIKPIRGAGAGPAQLNDYVRRLNQFATTAPDWMGSRARNWQAGPWRPRLQQRFSVGAQPVIVCVYPDTTPGVLLYDILTCPRVPPVPVRVPERVPVRSTVPVRIADAHPAFRGYAAQVPELRPTLPGREILVLLEAGLFGYALEEARRRQIEQITRPMRVDPRGIPLFQVQPVLIGGAFFAGIIVVPVLIAVLVVAIVALAYALATAIVAAASAVAEAAATATAGAALRWSVATFGRAAAATVAARIAAEGTMSQAEAAEALRPLIGKPIVAMGDVTARPDLANVQLGQKVSVGGQPFRSIIRLTSREG